MAGRERRVNLLAQSAEIRALHASRRGSIPILTADECEIGPEVTLTPEEVADVKIDQSYQRAEVRDQVNELTHVLMQGGVIPDPVSIAVRKDGSRWAVDGQQRYWAHLDTGKPMLAKLYYVRDRDAELKLFDALNNSVGLNTAVRINAWPGPASKMLHRLDEHPDSAIRARVGWKGKTKINYPAVILVRGMTSAISGTITRGGIRETLKSFDAHFGKAPKWADRACFEYVKVLASVFRDSRASEMKAMAAIALGRTCHMRWQGLYEGERSPWPTPNDTQLIAMQNLDWHNLVLSGDSRWVPVAQDAIEKCWPLPVALRKKPGA